MHKTSNSTGCSNQPTDHSFQYINTNLFATFKYILRLWVCFRKMFWSTPFYLFRSIKNWVRKLGILNKYGQILSFNLFFGSTNRPQFSIYWHESFFKIKLHPSRWVYFLGKCSEVPRSIIFRRIQNLVNNFFNLNNPVNGPFFLRVTDHSVQVIYMNPFAKLGYTDLLWIFSGKNSEVPPSIFFEGF